MLSRVSLKGGLVFQSEAVQRGGGTQAAPEATGEEKLRIWWEKKKEKQREDEGSFTQKPNHNYPLSPLTSLLPPSLLSALLPLSSPSASYHGNRRGGRKTKADEKCVD